MEEDNDEEYGSPSDDDCEVVDIKHQNFDNDDEVNEVILADNSTGKKPSNNQNADIVTD